MSPDDPAEPDSEAFADPVPEPDSAPTPVVDGATESIDATRSSRRALVPSDPFRRYLFEIRKYPALSRDEELDLARRYRQTGDREALFRLITSNLMLVVRVAMSFRRAARNTLDLIQEGNVGLMQAIERFDPELGVRLPTYAAWWIRAYIIKFLLDNVRMVRVGTTNARRKLLYNLRQEKAKLEERGFEAGPRLLAEHFGVAEEDVVDVEQALRARDVSLDAPVREDDGRTHGEILPSERPGVEEEVARRELQERVQEALGRFRKDLGERERAILDDRILAEEPATLQALGDRFGTTREAVRQAEVRLMARLKTFLTSEFGDLASVRIGPA